jgi:transposase, IS30 family
VYQHFSDGERHSLSILRVQGLSQRKIAQALARDPGTICRELKRNRSTHDSFYRYSAAGELARGRLRRSRRNQRYGPDDFVEVERLLRLDLSPEQIVGRAKLEGVPIMSHQTIYRWIEADKQRGGSLYLHLRYGRNNCRKRYRGADSRGRLNGKRMIGERPAVVEQRSRATDWEIDTVHGNGKACLVTIVERKTGLLRLGPIAQATAKLTQERTVELLKPHKIHTITSDNGTEFHGYKYIEEQLGATFYFATPHHAWERGTNENTNGLIRQYFAKGCPLAHVSIRLCLSIQERLNNRPRKRLGYLTPNEAYFHSNKIASCGKLFGSCPRKRSNIKTFKPSDVALQM